MARYTSGKQGVIPRYDIASILVFNERIYEYGDKVKQLISWKSERLLQIKVLQTVHKYSCKCQLAIRFRHALCSKYYLNKQFEN